MDRKLGGVQQKETETHAHLISPLIFLRSYSFAHIPSLICAASCCKLLLTYYLPILFAAPSNVTMKRGDRCRLLSLPDEILECILRTVTNPSDRCNVSLVCSRFHRISRRTPRKLLFEFIPCQRWGSKFRDWLRDFDIKSRAFPRITSLNVHLSYCLRDYLLAGIGATCGQLTELRLLTVNGGEFEATASGWRSLARQCPHLTHLELNSRFGLDSSYRRYEDRPALPCLHAFPSLRAVTLGFYPKEISPLLRCSALTSLSLWQPTGGNLACLASPTSSFRSSLQSLTIQSANLTN
ncbi:unnamed protein product [Closterium sp. NIES-54]